MPYLPSGIPAPHIDDNNEPFWQRCNERILAFQQCVDCLKLVHPPLPVCPRCQSLKRQWLPAPTEATVFTFTWAHTAAHASVSGILPYNVVVVEFPQLPDVRFVSNVVNVQPGELAIGDRLRLHWEHNPEHDRYYARFVKIDGEGPH